jgi:hypothetical protein
MHGLAKFIQFIIAIVIIINFAELGLIAHF